ncbi:Hypothetical_protein [Hexamita inflata]|uniref:Hypothetical_protein n=1 Tax=Hexamita inflata TaxID=28002 RepID=A0AA86U0A2_9EUKA|nr:Hypothetical protein HINF_LOCUS24510 [Hexamita inflata]
MDFCLEGEEWLRAKTQPRLVIGYISNNFQIFCRFTKMKIHETGFESTWKQSAVHRLFWHQETDALCRSNRRGWKISLSLDSICHRATRRFGNNATVSSPNSPRWTELFRATAPDISADTPHFRTCRTQLQALCARKRQRGSSVFGVEKYSMQKKELPNLSCPFVDFINYVYNTNGIILNQILLKLVSTNIIFC